MGDTTAIAWADKTFNGWIGCTKVADECKFCYADRDNKFHKWNGGVWGPGTLRKITAEANWEKPLQWNREAAKIGAHPRVFAFSLADVFDVEGPLWPHDRRVPGYSKKMPVPPYGPNLTAMRVFFYNIVMMTQNLEWLVLTKRFVEAAEFCYEIESRANSDSDPTRWKNLSLLFSAGNQDNLEKAMSQMRRITGRKNGGTIKLGISAEPLLGPLNLRDHLPFLDWVIVGGESGPHARPMDLEWVRDIQLQCAEAGVAFFMKQTGAVFYDSKNYVIKHLWDTCGHPCDCCGECPSNSPDNPEQHPPLQRATKDRAGAVIEEWPAEIQRREFAA